MRAELTIPAQWTLTLQRENVISIMRALKIQFLKNSKLHKQMNWCRIKLQVITLSDIADISDHKLCLYAQRGEQHPHRKTIFHWPNQGDIAIQFWKLVTSTIKKLFTYDGNKLYSSLGNCHTTWIKSHQWDLYRDTHRTTLVFQTTPKGQ